MRKNAKNIETVSTVSEGNKKLYDVTMRNIKSIGCKFFVDIPVELLYSDERFQRVVESSGKKIRLIKENWNVNKLDALKVSPHSEQCMFSVIDGHHRLQAAKLCGIEYLPCEVILGLSANTVERLVQEAEIFATQDDEVEKLTPQQKHKANLILGVKKNVILQKIADKYEIKLRPSAKGRGLTKIGYLQGFTTALDVANYGEEYLDRVFNILTKARWNLATNGFCTQTIHATWNILRLHKNEIDTVHNGMIEYFKMIQPEQFLAEAMAKYPERKRTERNTMLLEDFLVENYGIEKVYYGGIVAA